jgi:hypothetical protein
MKEPQARQDIEPIDPDNTLRRTPTAMNTIPEGQARPGPAPTSPASPTPGASPSAASTPTSTTSTTPLTRRPAPGQGQGGGTGGGESGEREMSEMEPGEGWEQDDGDGEGDGGGRAAKGGASRGGRNHRQLAIAWGTSAAIHVLILIIAALITVRSPASLTGREDPEPVGIAVLLEEDLGSMSDVAVDTSTPSITDALTEPLAVEIDLAIPDALASFDQPLDMSKVATELTSGLGAGDLSAGSLGGAGGSATFFGVEAKGSRFAYIVDISGSMEVGVTGGATPRIEVLKRELMGSVAALSESARFFIVIFSHTSAPLGGKLEWTPGNEPGKSWARRAIAALRADGGTEPLPAFELVFAIRPRPDAIYFMTDGEFHHDAPRRIALMNGDLRIPIHTICFDSREGEQLMRRIAEDSGGTYTFVSGERP